jgi:anti-sigma-K factor RskA
MQSANDGLRFILELSVLGALGFWGFTNFNGVAQWLVGIAAPVAVAVLWGVFVSPQGPQHTDDPFRLVLELAIFGAGVAALAAAGRETLALMLGAVVALHLGLTFPLDQR